MKKWRRIEPTTVQKVGYKWVAIKQFVLPDGEQSEFTTWGKTGANNVAVIALTEDNRVIVARQFRPGPEAIFDELPGGGAEPEEDLASAAARELLEETGYASSEPLEYLGPACRDAYTNETNNYFLAKNCKLQAEQHLDDTEFVEIVLIPIPQLIANAKTAKMSDGVAVAMAYDTLVQLQEKG